MSVEGVYFITFRSVTYAQRAERLLSRAGFRCRIQRSQRWMAEKGCGYSLRLRTVLGHVQDNDGQKMSKSKGNAVDPMDALNKYGADAIRWYFYSNSAPWLPNRFHEDAVVECQRKFMGTLWNTYAFYVLYANIDNFNPLEHELEYDKLSLMDKWLLSKLNSTVKAVDANLGAYKIPETTRVLEEVVDDMSN